MPSLFISDLHLDITRPQITASFLAFLTEQARYASELYILGDLFESYLGDDDDSELNIEVACALAELTDIGVPVWLMRGNRDFLIGGDFARRCGACLLPDPAVILVDGEPTLLMHGDLLCLDDITYQHFRMQVRATDWQTEFLSQPLTARREFAEKAKAASKMHQQGLSEAIMDVNPAEVERVMRLYGVNRLIHGHTHRPAVHAVKVGDRSGERIVLGDWYEQGSVLSINEDQAKLRRI